MFQFLSWYLLVSLLGWLTFPLAYRLFPALVDRGFSLARALGMLVWGYAFWMMASLGIIQNDGGGLLLALTLLIVLSALASWKAIIQRPSPIVAWLKSNRRMVITVEVLFFLAFAVWAFVRASNPNIETAGGEKTMELAFINAILRSLTFPPYDPWLSGYAISYYYFGYVMTAMLAKATGTLGSVAHNLMSALVFALSFIGAYGILYNLLALWRKQESKIAKHKPSIGLPLLGPLFLLFVSNLEGFLEVLHKRGLFWQWSPDGTATSSFWSWLGITNLVNPPSQPVGWVPERFIWWWQASRVVADLDLVGNRSEIIDEFPAFSYLLGDLHPHVLAMPFGLLAVALTLNLFLGGWKGETKLSGLRWEISPAGFLISAYMVGSAYFMNTWDAGVYLALFTGAYILCLQSEKGWRLGLIGDALGFILPIGLLGILLYFPFVVGFSSQAGGILPNITSPTRGAHLWVMFAPLFLALLAYLVYLWHAEKRPRNWKWGLGLASGLVVVLWLFSWALALLASQVAPGVVTNFINTQCSGSVTLCFTLTTLRRLSFIGGLLTLLSLLGMALLFIIPIRGQKQTSDHSSSSVINPTLFVLMLIFLGALLVLAPDFIYLRDLFGSRLNTIFKFYFQAWLLWSLAAAFGVAVMLQKLCGAWNLVYRICLVLVLFMALIYPVLGLANKTGDFRIPAYIQSYKAAQAAGDPAAMQTAARVWTLDGAQLFQRQYPDDAAAARWLSTAPAGVIAEVVSKNAYSDYGRMAAYSGQPTVLGWWWHEYQWRGSVSEQVSPIQDLSCRASYSYDSRRMRSDDISCLYETSSWDEAAEIIAQYNIRYVVVGTLERRDYRVNELKFQQHLTTVFQQEQVVVYELP
ncbi:MAG: DUF2298 domain-containing protein [Chloroflexota bacterium]